MLKRNGIKMYIQSKELQKEYEREAKMVGSDPIYADMIIKPIDRIM